MRQEGLHGTHLDILRYVRLEERTVSQIADHVERSISWTSECVRHLVSMDLVVRSRNGLQVLVRPASNELAQSLRRLIVEAPLIDLSVVLDKAGLALLPLLLDPGATAREMARRTGLSLQTVRSKLRRWRGMGVALRDGGSRRYELTDPQEELRSFLEKYSEWHNRRVLADVLPEAVIVWQWRDEFLFSTDRAVDLPDFMSAGPTRLEELGYDILHLREYYHHHPLMDEVSEEEALVQSLRVDGGNPRMTRFIVEGVKSRGVALEAILEHGGKYGLRERIRRVVSGHGRTG